MKYVPVFPSLIDYVRKDVKVPFMICIRLAARQTKIIAAVKTAV